MTPILKLTNVNKNFGGVVVAKDICLELYPGNIHGLIGPNGAGKTTLLNLISGIYDVDSGKIEFCGNDITKTPPHDRARLKISRTFQSPRFLDRANIEENLMLARDLGTHNSFLASLFMKKDKSYYEQLNMLAEMAGLSFYLENDISSLTYGQQKLLEIIRAMLTDPKVILVDEPAAGLNGGEMGNAIKLIEWAAREKNVSIILIEHSMDMIMSVCQKITVLNFGSIIAYGSPAEIASNEDVITAYLGRDNDV